MNINLPKSTRFVLKTLQAAGFEGYIVGGCVRDALMGYEPHDYDITTSATPDEVKAIFTHTADTGIKHGTVTVIEDNTPIEVTTFRTESGYSDSRHPDRVEFVRSLESDLARRDFTVNAICYSPATGIIDPFGGEADINSRILRTVGNPDERFFEDALRILRLFRFAATLGFEIEGGTLAAAYKNAGSLSAVSRERIAEELKKAVLGNSHQKSAEFLNGGALEFCGISGVNENRLALLPKHENLRLFAFLNTDKNDISKISRELKLSRKLSDYLLCMSKICALPLPQDRADTKRLLRDFGADILSDSLIYRRTIFAQYTEKAELTTKEILDLGEPYLISHLKISGEDIKGLGIEGAKIGSVLTELLEKVISNPELNQKDRLLNLIKSN